MKNQTKWERGKPWTRTESIKAINMRSAGMPFAEIAQRLGRTEQSVMACWKRREAILSTRTRTPRDRFVIKKTEFLPKGAKVSLYKEIMFYEAGSPSQAWDIAISIIRKMNSNRQENDTFYWLEYR